MHCHLVGSILKLGYEGPCFTFFLKKIIDDCSFYWIIDDGSSLFIVIAYKFSFLNM